MADTPTTEQTAAAATPAVAAHAKTEFKVSLENFATKLSGNDKRVALIHGWVHTMKAEKKFRDLPSNYAASFAAFAGTPIHTLRHHKAKPSTTK